MQKKSDVSDAIIERLVNLYEESGKGEDNALHFAKQGPTVFLFVGVNGVGKTTTIGKLAHRYKEEGKRFFWLLAIRLEQEQLSNWQNGAEESGSTLSKTRTKRSGSRGL